MVFDMIGKTYDRLYIIDQYYKTCKNGEKRDFCLCRCACGKTEPVEINGKNIRSGKVHSCGCYAKERKHEIRKKYNSYDLSGDYGICYFFNSNHGYFIFDIDDFDKIKNFCWHCSHGYATTQIPYTKTRIRFHNMVIGLKETDVIVDHINRNTKDNRKENLRITTQQKNNINKKASSKNTSGIVGVSLTEDKTWEVLLNLDGKKVFRKRYDNFNDAVIARLTAEKYYFGEFAPQRHLFEQYGII